METIAGSIKYITDNVFVQPSLEKLGAQNKIFIIPVMKFLENLSTGGITKFVTIAALRPDKCENLDVLKFIKDVSEF